MKSYQFLVFLGLMVACGGNPSPISYGHDACSFCQMTIVDKQHSAQIVTVKGKSYKYDAIECMLNEYRDWDRPEVKLFLVADYNNPGVLLEAESASYLISERIPSPMGEFLTAFASEEDRSMFADSVGELHDWNSLKRTFDILDQD